MINLELIQSISPKGQNELSRLLKIIGNPPTLENIWLAMNRVWDEMQCIFYKKNGDANEHTSS